MKTLIAIIGIVAVCLTSAASAALAGGGGGGGGATATSTTAWVSASPNPAAAWGTRVNLAGCGFAFAPAEVRIVHSAGYTSTYMVGMWSMGCMDTAYFTTSEPGTYRIDVYQRSSTKRNATTVLKATTTLTVT
jgi:hypothetical protein